MEKQTAGSWTEVGYSAPGTKDDDSKSHTNVIEYTEAANNVWTAKPKSDLNDCTMSAGSWTITPTVGGTNVKYVTGGHANCTALTPSWDNLSRDTGS